MDDKCFESFDSFWNAFMSIDSITTLNETLGPLSVTKFDSNGFDAKALIDGIIRNAAAAKRSKAQFCEDLVYMIVIGLTNGNIRATEGRIKELSARYKIRIRAANAYSRIDGRGLTFARTISLFPNLASMLLHKSPGITRKVNQSSLNVQELPSAMQHFAFASLIPKCVHKTISTVFMFATIAYMIDFSKTITPSLVTKTAKELYQVQDKYFNIAYAKSRYAETAKIGYLMSYGLHLPENFTKVINVASRLQFEVFGSVMDAEGIKKEVMKNNVLHLADEAAQNATAATGIVPISF
ncbi:unnamed protein product [Cuscuta epithymum]|uniref:Nucleoprotein n=1 Tax=Cuscuta epithymum TaxID=186058 RepID=A0AAV0D5W7_9ASTE|nr:unnamed protein product [Cuscuta epithymum]